MRLTRRRQPGHVIAMSSTPKLRMSRPDDARALRSREALRGAVLSLVQEKSFDEISIREIVARAGVSHPVFYRRYRTKVQILEDIATEELRNLLTLTLPIFNANRHDESLFALCHYIDNHRILWTQLLTGSAGAVMREEFKHIALQLGNIQPRINPWLSTELAASFVASSLFEILVWWLAQPADYPVKNVVKIIDTLVVRSTARPVDIRFE